MSFGKYKVVQNTGAATAHPHFEVLSPDGISLKAYGYNTMRGCGMAQRRAEAFASACHMRDIHNANRAIVASNRCPECGKGIKRNLSLAGWWQCEQFGAPQFRKHPELPPCNWQCFTE